MMDEADSLKDSGAEHEDSFPFLDLPYGEEVELVVVGQPIFAAVHSAFPLYGDQRKDYGCRAFLYGGCPICSVKGFPSRSVVYCVVRSEGNLYLFKALPSLLNLVDFEPGLRLRLVKVKGRPYFHIVEKWTDLEAITFNYDDKPRTLINRITSQDYWMRHGGPGILDFFNRRPD